MTTFLLSADLSFRHKHLVRNQDKLFALLAMCMNPSKFYSYTCSYTKYIRWAIFVSVKAVRIYRAEIVSSWVNRLI